MKYLKTLSLYTLMAAIVAIGISSCKKYPEGGYVNRTEKNLKKTWKLDKYLVDGVDQTVALIISNYEETYASNNDHFRSYIDKKGQLKSENGKWEFGKDDKQLKLSGLSSIDIIASQNSISSSYYNIIKLDSDEFWYRFENGSNTHEFRLVKK
jgi:hypothetical protein